VRIAAYLTLAATASGLIAVGTICSEHPIAAAVAMLVIGFAVLFSGVVNGYLAASGSAVLLTFILPALVPADADAIGARIGGFWIAVALAVPAALFLFPARPRDRLRDGVAACCRALAAYVRHPSEDGAVVLNAAVEELHARFDATPFRPTGPTGATGALAAMIDEIDWLRGLAVAPAADHETIAPTPGEAALRELSADALLASATLVEGRLAELPDRDALERGRETVFEELIAQLEDPAVGDDDQRLWAAVARAWDVRVLSYLVLDLSSRAVLAGGGATGPDGARWMGFLRRQGVALAATERVAAAHVGADSVWFRNSLRGAVGLALAVLIAGETSLQHAFWVVLGSLSVLRSSALNTGSTIVQALVGTVVGILLGAVLLLIVGGSETINWIALPFAVFLAAYAPRAISFAAGQAGFTVAIFALFNLLAPTGRQIGLVRLEDVAIGFGISLGVGLLFWPRGAGSVLRRSLDEALVTGARFVQGVFERVAAVVPEAPVLALEAAADAADDRLDVALRQRLAERPSHDPRLATHTQMVSVATRLRGTALALKYLAQRLGALPRPDAALALRDDARLISAWYIALADGVSTRTPPPPPMPRTDVRAQLVAAIRAARDGDDPDALFAAVAVAWAGLHLQQLRRLQERVVPAAEQLAHTAS